MRFAKGSAFAALGKSAYSAEALSAAALVLGERAQVFLDETKKEWRVEIRPARKSSAAALRGLAAEFLDEALSHEARQRVVCECSALTTAVLSPLFAKGFPAVPPDPLEELEPTVREDRARDLAELLAAARRLG